MSKKVALITGMTGQDGSYLAELLLNKGYSVHGIIRPSAYEAQEKKLWRLLSILDKIELHTGSLDDSLSLYKIISSIKPDECYHLAAQSFVSYDLADTSSTLFTNINGTLNLLSFLNEIVPKCRFYFAGSSEMFGNVDHFPQTEDTPFMPRSLYGISKLSGYHIVRNYRVKNNMHASCGILYNHESPRRGEEFVTRKITKTAVEIKLGLAKHLHLGNLEAMRDWGYSKDYVNAMWLMLQQDKPDDYIVATGNLHSVKDFVKIAFDYLGLNWEKYVVVDERFFRPSEQFPLCGSASKANRILNWKTETTLIDIVRLMVDEDLRRFQQ